MEQLTGIERVRRILHRQPVDRIAVCEAFWSDTIRKWVKEGHLQENEQPAQHFGFDLVEYNPFRLMGDYIHDKKIIEENEDTVLYEDGNGVLQKRMIKVTNVPQLLRYTVKSQADWEQKIKPLLIPEPGRLNLDGYRKAKAAARDNNQFFFVASMNVFELLRALCGHETILVAMALELEWIADMVRVYAALLVDLMEMLFAEAGEPDGIWFFEDMGFKEHAFFSPDMYRALIQPAHRLTMQYAHSRQLPVVCHSCGMVEPLIPGLIEAGIDCLQAIEVKAGMDLNKLYHLYGDQIAFIGGIDTRILISNDLQAVNAELEAKIPVVMGRNGYILHSDHSIPYDVSYETYLYFVKRGLELGTYPSGR
jgi:uroporphyrinogen decarboxylase